jgi:hypothetical protein
VTGNLLLFSDRYLFSFEINYLNRRKDFRMDTCKKEKLAGFVTQPWQELKPS